MTESILIVADGPSSNPNQEYNYKDLIENTAVRTIAVNGAIELRGMDVMTDTWFTLDPSEANMRRMSRRMPGVNYYCACPPEFNLPHWVHRKERIATSWAEDHPAPYWIKRWSCTLGLQEDSEKISTGNSAYGALNLAYHMRPKVIYLLGVDGVQKERASGGMPNDLSHLPFLFASATPQLYRAGIAVINLSQESAIDCFEKKTIKEVLDDSESIS